MVTSYDSSLSVSAFCLEHSKMRMAICELFFECFPFYFFPFYFVSIYIYIF